MRRVGIVANQVAGAAHNYDLVIRNGTIFDGLKTPRFVSDIGIKDGKVATIGRIAKSAQSGREIDASGLNVCPGFVDLHTHYDAQLFWDPYLTTSGWHGVTSVVIGNCGFGYAPCKPENRDRAMQTLERTEAIPFDAQKAGLPWDWVTFPEYMDSVERTPKGLNIMSYFGLAPVMVDVMGLENARKRPATQEEMDEMKQALKDAMAAGACGFSAQVAGKTSVQRDYDGEPMVTDTMSKEDLYAFGSVLAEVGAGFIQVAGPSMKTTENLAKASGRPILYNAITVSTDQHGAVSQDSHTTLMKWLQTSNREKGLRIFGQAINQDVDSTFSLDNWNLFDSNPNWRNITLGTPEERMAKMRDPKIRQTLIDEYDSGKGPLADGSVSRDNAVQGDKLVLHKSYKESLEQYEGMDLPDVAKARGQHIVDCMLDLSLETDLKMEWKTLSRLNDGNADDELKKVAVDDFTIPGVSDGGAHTKFLTLGDYPTRFLASLTRDKNFMSLEDAHWKLSKYPAQASGMLDRGSIEVGMPADILVYDLKKLRSLPEEILYDLPAGEWRRVTKSEGYHFTIVNGQITFEGMECTGATPGRLLRHGRAQDMI